MSERQVVSTEGDLATVAVASERLLFPRCRVLGERKRTGVGKSLLVRDTAAPVVASRRLQLVPLTVQDSGGWEQYTRERIAVEAGFGVDESGARRMVAAVRRRCSELGLQMFAVRDGDQVVGAVGWLVLPAPMQYAARLQEVDVYPRWRGRGYGNGLLAAVLAQLTAEKVTSAVIGADEDDWPVSWYQRRGFSLVARVELTR